jgi:hypothetical protein
MTPKERRAYAAKKSRDWHASAAGQAYEKKRRERLFSPDWKLMPGPRKWRLNEDVAILLRILSDRQLARKYRVTMPALRQRRYRLQHLLYTSSSHALIAYHQSEYVRKLRKKVGNLI